MRLSRLVATACFPFLLASAAAARAADDTRSPTNDLHPVSNQQRTPLASADFLYAQAWSTDASLSKPGKDDDKKDKKDRRRRGKKDHGAPGGDQDSDGFEDDCPAPTPEPGTLLLLGAAAGAIGLRRRARAH